MKQVIFLVGLILAGSGLYWSYLAFMQIDTLEVLMLGLYLGGAFILMTLGLYMSLVVFAKNKKANPTEREASESAEEILLDLDDEEDTEINPEIFTMSEPTTMIEDTMVLNLFKEDPKDDKTSDLQTINEVQDEPKDEINSHKESELITAPQEDLVKDDVLAIQDDINREGSLNEEVLEISTQDDLEQAENFEEEELEAETQEIYLDSLDQELQLLEEAIPTEHDLASNISVETEITDQTGPQNVFNLEFDQARLIGIEGFRTQRILKKIPENAEVILKFNEKHGLKSSEIFYNNKSIGYLSKVDVNRMGEKLSKVYKITINTIVYDQNKVATVILKFMFKQNKAS